MQKRGKRQEQPESNEKKEMTVVDSQAQNEKVCDFLIRHKSY